MDDISQSNGIPLDVGRRGPGRKENAVRTEQITLSLPPAQREAFVLQHEAGMSVEDIAAATGVTRETAKSRLRYALAKLRLGMSKWQ